MAADQLQPPVEEPASRPTSTRRGSSPAGSVPRHVTTARLATPVPSYVDLNSLANPRDTTPSMSMMTTTAASEFGRLNGLPSSLGRSPSVLAAGLQSYRGPVSLSDATNLTRRGSSPVPPAAYGGPVDGSVDTRSHRDLTVDGTGIEDPDIIKRHLVQPDEVVERGRSAHRHGDEFSSLQLQGGDIHRQIYKWTQGQEEEGRRRRSFEVPRPEPEDDTVNANSIRVPGGFRRDYIRRVAASPGPQGHGGSIASDLEQPMQPPILTNNFLEFLTLYGHFAGEELEEDDEALEPDEYFTTGSGTEAEEETGEREALLPATQRKRPRKQKERGNKPTNSATGAILLLLKSFVGTGVLFLPRAFLNGGMVFSPTVLVAISAVSYWCFCLLIKARERHEGSFGDIGGALYGKHMRRVILLSIVLSQIGFVAAYLVFVSTNLQAFVLAASNCRDYIDLKWFILLQLVVFLPLSLVRDISKLGFTALVADAFILLGLLIIYGFNFKTIIANHGAAADVVNFNGVSWSLMVGTAIFTYEGVGLIIPIQESMKKPQQFKPVLALVMVIVTVVFVSMGMSGYAAFGSKTETVVILNLPQDDAFVNSVQFLYSVAILLSTPLQLFPAIRILENGLFTRSGKYNPGIKWKKNSFRFVLVIFCATVAWIGAADLDKFVALVGSFACVPLVYVYPPLLHLKIASNALSKVSDIVLAAVGLAGCLYTTGISIASWGTGSAEPSLGFCGL
ncbi:neutral amino acid transporter [Ascosphaera acerosa]|nr:neutral amino acid transporter [Ascosphaera acerosa]